MAGNFGGSSSIQPLSVGNVVSAGLRLYRSHFKDYFLLALKACLWFLVPIYGWAKCFALIALISRLAFGELVNQPESISSGARFVNSRLWKFLGAMILVGLIAIGVYLAVVIVFALFIGIFVGFFGARFQQTSVALNLLIGLITIILGVVAIVGIIWFLTRFYLVDLPLAIEENVDAASSISRSWELTQGHVWRIFLIGFVAFLITLPLQIVLQIMTTILQLALAPLIQDGSPIFQLLYYVLILPISFSATVILLPFWKTIQAVIYYDLRSRREGLGLTLRNHEI
ncbi:glycerophosphoryl diester phosphodiesterase membrane domain-containing protein [Fortiea contorta]|uniref:glycerophosphoryl diester phosphodiesterase membrane domain-containing protein n=1 Tax=Fortiea contorta TaxID=1892405 RepID=UPI000344A698|nr:glycerophosphoryl diester phosphodiesterase membrane domain-containing protein [Fortiea contorta]